jgi:hypothetical protein
LDWEDRIELKMVSMWRKADGEPACDKLKVCDVRVDPWAKLANVLWVFVDRVTRVVLGHHFTHLAGPMRERLAQSWGADLHFDDVDLFVESRDKSGGGADPAYYLSAAWFRREGLLPSGVGTRFDSKSWGDLRRRGQGKDPLITLISPTIQAPAACPRCGGPLHYDTTILEQRGQAPARHGMPLGNACALRSHLMVDPTELPRGQVLTMEEQHAAIESRVPAEELWRLANRVEEPEDHEH